ncbi:MAG: alpha-L-fucosidase [Phycisphaerales bacterium]
MKHAFSALCCTTVALMGCAETSSTTGDPQVKTASTGETTVNSHSSSGYNAEKAEAVRREDERMAWWNDARFGMFIHWGVYSVPAGTWNDKTTGGPSEWLMQSLKVPTSEYVKFADGFTADKYDPAAWAKLAKQAGMKYVVITSRHHDGFCLWDSAVSEWDVMASPAKRDLLKPLADATRAEGLHFCTYYSILDWRHPDYEPARVEQQPQLARRAGIQARLPGTVRALCPRPGRRGDQGRRPRRALVRRRMGRHLDRAERHRPL